MSNLVHFVDAIRNISVFAALHVVCLCISFCLVLHAHRSCVQEKKMAVNTQEDDTNNVQR